MNMAPAPEILVFMSVAPTPELFFHGSSSSFCSFSHINIFNYLGVPQVEWKMHYTSVFFLF